MEYSPASRRHNAFPAPSLHGSTAPTAPEKAPNVGVVVTSLTPCKAPGNLKCFATVKFGKWVTVNGFRLIHEEGAAKRPWVGLPSNHRDEPDPNAPNGHKRVYFPLIAIPDNWKDAAEQAVLAAWQEYQATGVLPGSRVIGGQGQ